MKRVNLYCVCLCLGALICAPAVLAQEPGDVYMWEFNEGSGTTVTDNSGEFVASIGVSVDPEMFTASSDDSPSGAAGDNSLVVNGGLVVDDSAETLLDLQEGPITIEAWVKPDELGGWTDIMRYGLSYKLGFAEDALVFTFLGVVDIVTEFTVEPDGNWHHYAVSWEPGVGVEFFWDGAFVEFIEETRAPQDMQNSLLTIGVSESGGSIFPGLIDRFRIHNAVMGEEQLDSDPASPAVPLDSTIVSYNFDRDGIPYENEMEAELPASDLEEYISESTRPEFSSDTPTGEEDDYSLYFDGSDRVIFTDEQDIMQFVNEDFSFEAWVKFDAEEQTSERPVLFAYGIGGQNGYSLSFRAAGDKPVPSDESPSGQEGDRSVHPKSGLIVEDSEEPVLDILEGPMTIECWVKLDSLEGWTDIARYGNSYKVGYHDNGNLVFTFFGAIDLDSEFAVEVDEAWHHVAYVWEPGIGVDFYYDGELASHVDTEASFQEVAYNALNIGSDNNGGSALDGLIDRFRLHQEVLDASQLDSDPNSPKEPLDSTLVAYNFDEEDEPYSNLAEADRPAERRSKGNTITVTTFGIIDAHSDVVIPDDGGWHHMAAVHEDLLEFRFYVDGELGETMPYDGGVRFAEVYDFIIGSEAGGGHPYTGLLDRVKVTRGALNEGDLDYFEPVGIEEWSLF